ncbi:ribonuclease III [Sphingomonas abietis]|uniref:Ribonuclease 3 n=1 Tax=Sphingomonas abietis TaxID=3012344 RepID=A0ABY7NH59_9SPHN|nr:ribonuclease III [Sphingomonas abietis]WBO20874.1 ribonuclease III [Sphingomonas abietis]
MTDLPPREVTQALGHEPRDPALFLTALTHSSHAGDSYQRLEFLGDRVLGLVMGEWLFALFPAEPEGQLSRRLNALVSGETCAEIARDLDLGRHLRLGKQARDDGAQFSTYVLGDVVEALIGALFLEAGIDGARAFIRKAWGDRVHAQGKAPKHPKAELQEYVAAKQWRPPVYEVTHRGGPHHAPVFTITVSIPGRMSAEGKGTSKQEAETEAARAMLKELK